MFVDLVGSTQLAAELDPEDLREVVGAYQDCCTRVIERFEGHVAKFLGDGVLAYFGYPQAHEDDAERAIRAGLDLVDAIGRLSLAVPLAARVGISTGEVVAGDLVGERSAEQQAVVGETPNRAARLQALAEPGSVVIGPHTRALVGRLFDYADLGAHADQGLPASRSRSRACSARAPWPTASRRCARASCRRWSAASTRSRCCSSAGSRRARARATSCCSPASPASASRASSRALCERLENRAHALLRYQCLPYYRHSAFQPVIEELERTAGIDRSDPAEARLGKLRAHLATLGPAGESLAGAARGARLDRRPARAPSALKLSPHQRKARLLAALVARIESMAARRPLLIVVEDVHWIDPSSMEFLELLIDRAARRCRSLVVVTGATAGGSAAYRRHAAHRAHPVAAQPAAERGAGGADGAGQAPARRGRRRDRDQDRGRAAVRRGADQGGAGFGSAGRSAAIAGC